MVYYRKPLVLIFVPKFLDNDFKWNSTIKDTTSVLKWGKLVKRVCGSLHELVNENLILDHLLLNVCDYTPKYNQQFIEVRFIPETIALHLKEDGWEFDLSTYQYNTYSLILGVREVFKLLSNSGCVIKTTTTTQQELN